MITTYNCQADARTQACLKPDSNSIGDNLWSYIEANSWRLSAAILYAWVGIYCRSRRLPSRRTYWREIVAKFCHLAFIPQLRHLLQAWEKFALLVKTACKKWQAFKFAMQSFQMLPNKHFSLHFTQMQCRAPTIRGYSCLFVSKKMPNKHDCS